MFVNNHNAFTALTALSSCVSSHNIRLALDAITVYLEIYNPHPASCHLANLARDSLRTLSLQHDLWPFPHEHLTAPDYGHFPVSIYSDLSEDDYDITILSHVYVVPATASTLRVTFIHDYVSTSTITLTCREFSSLTIALSYMLDQRLPPNGLINTSVVSRPLVTFFLTTIQRLMRPDKLLVPPYLLAYARSPDTATRSLNLQHVPHPIMIPALHRSLTLWMLPLLGHHTRRNSLFAVYPRPNVVINLRSITLAPSPYPNSPLRVQILYSGYTSLDAIYDELLRTSDPSLQDNGPLTPPEHANRHVPARILTLPPEIQQHIILLRITTQIRSCEHSHLECPHKTHSNRCRRGITSQASRHPRATLLGTALHRFHKHGTASTFLEMKLGFTYDLAPSGDSLLQQYDHATSSLVATPIVVSPSHLALSPAIRWTTSHRDIQSLASRSLASCTHSTEQLDDYRTSCKTYDSTPPMESIKHPGHTMIFS